MFETVVVYRNAMATIKRILHDQVDLSEKTRDSLFSIMYLPLNYLEAGVYLQY